MSFKPSDFFLSIVTFLGVLVPGGVFIFLCGPSIHALFPPQASAQYWVAILVASYVVGQILLAATELLNGVAGYLAWGFPTLLRKIKRDTSHPVQRFNGATFHEAISFVRLRSAAAAGEIDRHMADYKLLRNLVAVFLIDAVWSLIDNSHHLLGAGWDGLRWTVAGGGSERSTRALRL